MEKQSKGSWTWTCFWIGVFILATLFSYGMLPPAEASPPLQITEYPPTAPGHEQTSTPHPGATQTPWPETAPKDQFLSDQLLYALSVYVEVGADHNPLSGIMRDPHEIKVFDNFNIYKELGIRYQEDRVTVWGIDGNKTSYYWDCDLPTGFEEINWENSTPWYNQVEFDVSTCKATSAYYANSQVK